MVLENTKDSGIRNEARKNYIVNIVTALELFCVESIIQRKGKWNNEGATLLLNDKEKVSLIELIEIIKIGKVLKEDLIIKYYSFQNAQIVNKVFSNLIGEIKGSDKQPQFFINLISMNINDSDFGGKTIDKKMPDWYENFNRLFETRHKIIHEDLSTPIKKSELLKMLDSADLFAWACFIKFELLMD